MTTFFEQGGWEPKLHERLQSFIQQNRRPSKGSKGAYTIFDFDNTTVIGDIEDHFMIYFLENMLYKLTPETFKKILTAGPFDFDSVIEGSMPEFSLRQLADDIIDDYSWLFENYLLNRQANPPLATLKQTDQYKAFAAKLRFYYVYTNGQLKRQAGHPWVTYWFAGYTPEEVREITRRALSWGMRLKPERWVYDTPAGHTGHTGRLSASFEAGLTFPKELVNLYHALQANYIKTFIVSASPLDIVQVAGNEFGLQVAKNQIFGMEYTLNNAGKIEAKLKEDSYITKASGKTGLIRARILPQFDGQEPAAIFGDSMGDYDMMTQFQDTELKVLFNRLLKDDTQNIVQWAMDTYDQAEATYYLQGRDENAGQLRPSQATIPLGDTQAYLTPPH